MDRFQKHPAFHQPDNLDIKIWRYMEFCKFKWLVENRRLLMPAAEFLGDPLEGTQPTGDANWWVSEANKADVEKREIILSNAKKISGWASQFSKNYFVSCWHMNENENSKMWKSYTASSESVPISTRYRKLVEMLPGSLYSGVVSYIDYREEKLPDFNLFQYITHKDIRFKFESEIRIVAAILTDAHLKSKDYKDNVFTIDKNPEFSCFAPLINIECLVDEVVLHPEASTGFAEKIIETCSKFDLPKAQESIYK